MIFSTIFRLALLNLRQVGKGSGVGFFQPLIVNSIISGAITYIHNIELVDYSLLAMIFFVNLCCYSLWMLFTDFSGYLFSKHNVSFELARFFDMKLIHMDFSRLMSMSLPLVISVSSAVILVGYTNLYSVLPFIAFLIIGVYGLILHAYFFKCILCRFPIFSHWVSLLHRFMFFAFPVFWFSSDVSWFLNILYQIHPLAFSIYFIKSYFFSISNFVLLKSYIFSLFSIFHLLMLPLLFNLIRSRG